MATPTVSRDTTVQSQYASQVAVTTSLTLALRRLWVTLEPLSSATALKQYNEGVALVVEQFASLSISNAADFYQLARTNADVPGRVSLPIVSTPPRSLVDAGLDWAMRAKQQLADGEARIQARIEAAMQKAVTDAGREETVAAVEGDEKALGFARVARPDACPFCLSLAIRRSSKSGQEGRPGVYKSRSSAGQLPPNALNEVNRYHNNCNCTVVPVFSTAYELEPHLLDVERLYNAATENSERRGALNDFRRAVYAERNGRPSVPVLELPPTVAPIPGADALKALLDRLAA